MHPELLLTFELLKHLSQLRKSLHKLLHYHEDSVISKLTVRSNIFT